VLAVLAFLATGFLYYVFVYDSPPPKDDDLKPVRLEVPDSENAFTYLNFPDEKLYYPKDEEKQKRYNNLEAGKIWDEELAKEAIEHNKELMELFHKGMACKYFQVPEIKDIDAPMFYLGHWRFLARFMSLHACYLQKTEKEKEAFDTALEIVRFGHLIQNSGGEIITYLVGVGITDNSGLGAITSLLKETTLSSLELKKYIQMLAKYETNVDGLVNAFKLEYVKICVLIDMIASGRDKDITQESRWYRTAVRIRYFFRPNATKQIEAELYRLYIKDIENEFYKIDKSIMESFLKKYEPASYLSQNIIGKSIATYVTFSKTIWQKYKSQTKNRAVQILIALKCYKMEHGDLPDSLEKLVPDYFEDIPNDPYDGKPLRYSKEKKYIWSVGLDLVDKGGFLKEEQKPGKIVFPIPDDPTFKIEF
jgi:hypothetical protein